MFKSKTSFIILGVVIFAILTAIIYPTAFDKRANIYVLTKWAADTVALYVGYFSLVFGLAIINLSGGEIKKGLIWFSVGMFVMGSSFFFGPIINHYKIIPADTVEAIHGVFMLGGQIAYLIALYWFLRVGSSETSFKKQFILYLAVFIVFALLFTPTMFATRTLGNNIKYWAELTGFGLGGVMVAMAIRAFKYLGGAYRSALTWLLVSVVIMSISYIFGPISQPNHFWSGPQGGTYHHGTMSVAELFFLSTILFLNSLKIYIQKNPSQQS